MKRFGLLLWAVAVFGCAGCPSPSSQPGTSPNGTADNGQRPPALSTAKSLLPSYVTVSGARFSPDGKLLLLMYVFEGGSFRDYRLWDVDTGEQLRVFSRPVCNVWAFLPDGEHVVWGREGGRFLFPDLASKRWVETIQEEGPLEVVKMRTGEVVRAFDEASKGASCLAVSPDGKYAALRDRPTAELQLWDVATGKLHRGLGVGGFHVEFSPDSKVLHVGVSIQTRLDDGFTVLRSLHAASFDVATGRMTVHFQAKDDDERIVAFSPDGKFALTERWDRDFQKKSYLVLWDMKSGKDLRQFEKREGGGRPPSGGAYAATFSPDSSQVVTVDGDGMLRRWDVATGQLLWALEVD